MAAAEAAGTPGRVKPRALIIDGPAFLLTERSKKLRKSRYIHAFSLNQMCHFFSVLSTTVVCSSTIFLTATTSDQK